MYPLEMKFNKWKFGYININNCLFPLEKKNFVNQNYDNKRFVVCRSNFYLLPSTNDYILKVNKNINVHNKELYKLTKELIKYQSSILSVDFPIGYVINNLKVVVQIIEKHCN